MSTQTDFAARLKKLRASRGETQEEFAVSMGFTRSYISQIEGGAKTPGPRFIRDLERAEEAQRSLCERTPRAILKKAREDAGLSVTELAKQIGYQIGVLQAIEDGTARISQAMAEKLCVALPGLDLEILLGGSEQVATTRVGEAPSLVRPVGSKVEDIAVPPGVKVRVVPLISWAQAGAMTSFDDQAYNYEGHIAFDVKDPQSFAVALRGDSMQPLYGEGDIAILYPNFPAQNGDLVVARLTEEAGSDVMFKIFNSSRKDGTVTLTSYNQAYHPLQFHAEDFAWIYPVASVVKHLKK